MEPRPDVPKHIKPKLIGFAMRYDPWVKRKPKVYCLRQMPNGSYWFRQHFPAGCLCKLTPPDAVPKWEPRNLL